MHYVEHGRLEGRQPRGAQDGAPVRHVSAPTTAAAAGKGSPAPPRVAAPPRRARSCSPKAERPTSRTPSSELAAHVPETAVDRGGNRRRRVTAVVGESAGPVTSRARPTGRTAETTRAETRRSSPISRRHARPVPSSCSCRRAGASYSRAIPGFAPISSVSTLACSTPRSSGSASHSMPPTRTAAGADSFRTSPSGSNARQNREASILDWDSGLQLAEELPGMQRVHVLRAENSRTSTEASTRRYRSVLRRPARRGGTGRAASRAGGRCPMAAPRLTASASFAEHAPSVSIIVPCHEQFSAYAGVHSCARGDASDVVPGRDPRSSTTPRAPSTVDELQRLVDSDSRR